MSSDNYLLPGLLLLVACGLIGGSFWGGFHLARRLVEHPAAIVLLTLLFGSVISAVVATGLVAGCAAIARSPMFR